MHTTGHHDVQSSASKSSGPCSARREGMIHAVSEIEGRMSSRSQILPADSHISVLCCKLSRSIGQKTRA